MLEFWDAVIAVGMNCDCRLLDDEKRVVHWDLKAIYISKPIIFV